jgi:hypothetical protein
MPEAPEVETERLHEAIHEEMEKEGGGFLKRIALTTAVLAAFAAVASLYAGSTDTEALVLKDEATRLQVQASDQWTYYQAKGIKAGLEEAAAAAWIAAGKQPPPAYGDNQKRYKKEQQAIFEQAKEKERQRDEKSAEADHLLHREHGFAKAVTYFQISIALGAVAALTRKRWVWVGSILVGLGGIVQLAINLTA